jgi:hypothetical protein
MDTTALQCRHGPLDELETPLLCRAMTRISSSSLDFTSTISSLLHHRWRWQMERARMPQTCRDMLLRDQTLFWTATNDEAADRDILPFSSSAGS